MGDRGEDAFVELLMLIDSELPATRLPRLFMHFRVPQGNEPQTIAGLLTWLKHEHRISPIKVGELKDLVNVAGRRDLLAKVNEYEAEHISAA